jgi:mannitol-1-/sugar-/sorbitol-6-phosphatase
MVRRGLPGFRRAADLLGVPPPRCIAFEDAPAGVAAAVAAGTHVVAITSTVNAARLCDAHEVVPDLAAYLAVLSEFARMGDTLAGSAR